MAHVALPRLLICYLLFAICCFVLSPGCAPPMVATAGVSAVQAGTMAFVNGDMEIAARVPLGAAFAASHRGLARLEIPIEKETLHEGVGFLTGKLGDGRRIKIVLVRESPLVTKFSLRVGAFGDQPISRIVMVQIQDELAPEWGPPVKEP
jgi:hypothetical protein